MNADPYNVICSAVLLSLSYFVSERSGQKDLVEVVFFFSMSDIGV